MHKNTTDSTSSLPRSEQAPTDVKLTVHRNPKRLGLVQSKIMGGSLVNTDAMVRAAGSRGELFYPSIYVPKDKNWSYIQDNVKNILYTLHSVKKCLI